jgi:hypothetical protein
MRTGKLQAREVPFSPNPNAIILTGIKREWNEREEKKEERRYTSSNTHATAKGEASERSDTQRNTSAQATRRVP